MINRAITINKPNIQLVGITGYAGSGKDTVAAYLKEHYVNTYVMAFATPLKEGCAKLFGIPSNAFYDREEKEKIHEYWGVSPRQIAQFVGTEMFRELINELIPEPRGSFWIAHLAGIINGEVIQEYGENEFNDPYTPGDTIVIPDVRFQDEYDFITLNNGIILSLTRDGADGKIGIPGHKSESGIPNRNAELDFPIINNGTLEELYAQVDNAMTFTQF